MEEVKHNTEDLLLAMDTGYNKAIEDVLNKIRAAIIYPVQGVEGAFINKANIINAIINLKK